MRIHGASHKRCSGNAVSWRFNDGSSTTGRKEETWKTTKKSQTSGTGAKEKA